MTTTLHAPCTLPAATGSACSHLAVTVGSHKAEVARIARLASKSEATYAKYAGQLVKAKAELANTLEYLDAHMAECPGAVDRFGA